jgi:hypothetical protein
MNEYCIHMIARNICLIYGLELLNNNAFVFAVELTIQLLSGLYSIFFFFFLS